MNVTIPTPALTSGALSHLGLCPRHAAPPTSSRQRSFHTAAPVWVYPLILVGLLVAILVAMLVRKSATGTVPECDSCRRTGRRLVVGVTAGWVAWLALLVPVSNANAGVGFLWLASALVLFALSFTRDQWRVRGVLSKDQQWVELKGVHPQFAQAAEAAMAAARAAALQPVATPPGYAGTLGSG